MGERSLSATARAVADFVARHVFLVAACLRIGLIAFGEWQDRHMPIRYTDVDYDVFSDAAAHVAEGGSPYDRATYRYTPLLALSAVPNGGLSAWGKLVFATVDLGVGACIVACLRMQAALRLTSAYSAALWLLSPLTAVASTRGSADSLVCLLVLVSLLLLMRQRDALSGVVLGAAVHVKLFPIVFALPMALSLDEAYAGSAKHRLRDQSPGDARQIERPGPQVVPKAPDDHLPTGIAAHPSSSAASCAARAASEASSTPMPTLPLGALPALTPWLQYIRKLVTPARLRFCLSTAASFLFLTGACVAVYGVPVLEEGLLFHFARTDTRHNFSSHFLRLYLTQGPPEVPTTPWVSRWAGAALTSPVTPQAAAVLGVGALAYRDLPACLFLQALCFVALNKVVTAQYFCWWMALLPLVAWRVELLAPMESLIAALPFPSGWQKRTAAAAAWIALPAAWLAGELLWLGSGYLVEMRGLDAFAHMWGAGAVLLLLNIALACSTALCLRWMPTFRSGALVGRGSDTGDS